MSPEILDNAKLHDEKENIPANTSGNRPFIDVARTYASRRDVVKGGVAAAAAGFFAPTALAGSNSTSYAGSPGEGRGLVNFRPVPVEEGASDARMPHISRNYRYQTLIPWGTDLLDADNDYNGDLMSRPSADEAATQVGIGHDGMWFFPIDQSRADLVPRGYRLSSTNGLLVVNHEFGANGHVLGFERDDSGALILSDSGAPISKNPESLEDVRLSQTVHGVTVAEITYGLIVENRSASRGWELVRGSSFNRRITVNTPVEFSGPVACSELLENEAGNMPAGTVNNCGSGPTPWGTYITCEENFNGYFGANGKLETTEEQERYGFSNSGFGYQWHVFDERFDLNNPLYANEQNRFGWCVEIDPFNPDAKPVKRTALGRFKHEAIAIKEIDRGRIAAYMGDDQRFDYCYKYESNRPWRQAIDDGESPLDDGKLFVARYNDDGTGQWIELTIENPALAARFSSQAELLVYTRVAADIVGATPMDRPEWTTIGKDGETYWTLTNNSRREEPNVANPEAPNGDGHIIKTMDVDSENFNWEFFVLASSSRDTEGVFTDPDAAWADADGRLFIGTDGGQPDGLQDQLVVFDTTADGEPEAKRLFVGVASDEITGFATTPNCEFAFINIQHPGNGLAEATNFPARPDGITTPRDCTVVLRRVNGGVIGS